MPWFDGVALISPVGMLGATHIAMYEVAAAEAFGAREYCVQCTECRASRRRQRGSRHGNAAWLWTRFLPVWSDDTTANMPNYSCDELVVLMVR